ncbi:MAG: class I SAM-dependent methyltransferase [Planctomycetota bacterium]|nr:class I SAM-dependent methyltransferase [Planctomycetota bacterium]
MAARRTRPRKSVLTARTADKYALYEAAVYEPDADYSFIQKRFRAARGRPATQLREDFAGTSKLSALWARKQPTGHAWAVDLDPEPLAWGFERHIEPLGEAAARVTQLCENVLTVETPKVDAVTAFNFSYWTFRERATMLAYFRRAFRALKPDGVFLMDMLGGPGAQEEVEEPRRFKGFTYVWEQEPLDAITQDLNCHIHFRFPDGTEMKRAFSYHWRLWSVTELRDLLREAGFAEVEVYWEGDDGKGHGNGVFRRREHADNEEAWVAYVVGWKKPARS